MVNVIIATTRMSTKLSFGPFMTPATAALAFDDCIFIHVGDEDDDLHLRADAAAA